MDLRRDWDIFLKVPSARIMRGVYAAAHAVTYDNILARLAGAVSAEAGGIGRSILIGSRGNY